MIVLLCVTVLQSKLLILLLNTSHSIAYCCITVVDPDDLPDLEDVDIDDISVHELSPEQTVSNYLLTAG